MWPLWFGILQKKFFFIVIRIKSQAFPWAHKTSLASFPTPSLPLLQPPNCGPWTMQTRPGPLHLLCPQFRSFFPQLTLSFSSLSFILWGDFLLATHCKMPLSPYSAFYQVTTSRTYYMLCCLSISYLSVLNTTTEHLNPMKVGDRGSLIYSRSWKQTTKKRSWPTLGTQVTISQ